jgi:1,4-dihydroxy-2-naphthoyl-CoA synthase
MPRAMTDEELREFLSHGTRTAKLATVSPNGAPHAMPVWFVLDGDQLVFEIGGRYMGAERADEFGRRNAVPGELLVRVTPRRVIAQTDVAGY